MRKLVMLVAAVAVAEAKFYVGLKTGAIFTQLNSTFSGVDTDLISVKTYSINTNGKNNALLGGLFAGYSFMEAHNINPFIEVDALFQSKTTTFSKLSSGVVNGVVDTSSVRVRKQFEVGGMFGVAYKVTQSVSPFFGVRIAGTQYKLDAVDSSVPPVKTAYKKFLLAVEPTIGVKFNVSEKISIRGSVGYSIQENYKTNDFERQNGLSSFFSIKPRSVNFNLGLAYTF